MSAISKMRLKVYHMIAIAALVVAVLIVAALAYKRKTRKETFSFGNLFKKIGDGVKTGFGVVKNTATGVYSTIKDKASYNPTFVGRQHNGFDWQCPDGTIDTGREDHLACLASGLMYPLWRWDGKSWGHTCPNGTVPTPESQWEKKCEGGWVMRGYVNGKWQCPPGTWDSGASWENRNWHDAQKQCKISSQYSTRVWDGKVWTCPPGFKDTGRNWGMSSGEKQCKLIAG